LNQREAVLVSYSEQFRTQGNLAGKHWFLGIEEGGCATEAEVDATLSRWDNAGQPQHVSLNDPGKGKSDSKWFDLDRRGGPAIQKTWGAQIRVLLSMQGLPDDRESVRAYQSKMFGTPQGETCLMELLPLPNPGLHKWIYNEISSLPQFSSRQAFIEYALEKRIAQFRELVLEYQPATVVGLCFSQRHWLERYLEDVENVQAISGNRPGRAVIGSLGNTTVAITYHPNTPMTAPNRWYNELGQLIANRSDELQGESLRVQLQLPFNLAA